MAEITKTVETIMETVRAGKNGCRSKTYPVTITRLRSPEPWQYEVTPGQWKLVDAVTIFDAGSQGTSVVLTEHRDYTEEQRRAGRKQIEEVLRRCMTEQGLW